MRTKEEYYELVLENRALAQTVEMELTPKAGTPLEYRHYVRERDKAVEK